MRRGRERCSVERSCQKFLPGSGEGDVDDVNGDGDRVADGGAVGVADVNAAASPANDAAESRRSSSSTPSVVSTVCRYGSSPFELGKTASTRRMVGWVSTAKRLPSATMVRPRAPDGDPQLPCTTRRTAVSGPGG